MTENEREGLQLRARRGRRATMAGLIVAVVVVLVASGIAFRSWYRMHRWHQRIDAIARLDERYRARPRTGREALYGEALPQWAVALQARSESEAAPEIRSSFRALRAATAAAEPSQLSRVDRLRDYVDSGILSNAYALIDEFRAWNSENETAHVPYILRPYVLRDRSRVRLLISSYRVLADGHVTVGSRTTRARMLVRVDGTNIRESELGLVSNDSDGAIVLTDRSIDAAVTNLWPLFDPTGVLARQPIARAHRDHVLRELRAALSPSAYDTLARTAPAFNQLMVTGSSLGVRDRCPFRVVAVPFFGLQPGDLGAALDATDEDRASPACPPIGESTFEQLLTSTEQLATTPALDEAIQALGAWLVRTITVHESRHAADALTTGGIEVGLPCFGCPADFDVPTRAELSAYLAGIAAPSQAYTTLYEACRATQNHAGSNGRALRFAAEQLVPGGCFGVPPDDLADHARALEMSLFGRSEPIVVPTGFENVRLDD